MEIARLQRAMARTWPGLEQQRLGEWEMRASGGFTGRANSTLPCGDPGLSLSRAVEEVEGFYRARGLPAKLQVPSPLTAGQDDPAADVAAYVDRNGWTAEPWTLVMVREARVVNTADQRELELRWATEPDDDWLNQYHYAGAELPPAAKAVISSAPARYLTAYHDGELVGIGRAAVADGVLALAAIEVVAGRRRRGYGAVITEALAASGGDAPLVALQVFEHNEGAVELYRRLGFEAHHRYRYRAAP